MRNKSSPIRISRDLIEDNNDFANIQEVVESCILLADRNCDDLIKLEINDKQLQCSKSELMRFSGYFNAMFTQGYAESKENTIKLKENEISTFVHLIKCSKYTSYSIPEEDIAMVLKNAFIFQFDSILETLKSRLILSLSPSNCLSYLKEDLPFDDLNMKIKFVALRSFDKDKISSDFLQLNLKQICDLLGSVFLKCNQELDVFVALIKWFENYENLVKDYNSDVLKQLLYCLSFSNLTDDDIEYISKNNFVNKYEEVKVILQKLIELRKKNEVGNLNSDEIHMLHNSKTRRDPICLCMVLDDGCSKKKVISKTSEGQSSLKTTCSITDSKVTLVYDIQENKYSKLTDIDERFLTSGSENGYVLSYNDQLLFLGKQEGPSMTLSYNYTAYNPLKQTWSKILLLPPSKRHFFKSVISGDVLYIAGGIGSFRIVQDNLNSCNIKTGEWYGAVTLPQRWRELICCDYLGSLFVINLTDKVAYLYKTTTYTSYPIIDYHDILDSFNQMFTVFSHRKNIYMMGNKTLIQFVFDKENFLVSKVISIEDPVSDYDSVDAVVCEDYVFCLYKTRVSIDDDRKVTFTKYDLKQHRLEKIFDNISEYDYLHLNGSPYRVNLYSKILPLEYYKVLEHEEFVNVFQ